MVARRILEFLGLFERGLENANRPVLREFTINFKALPKAFDGFKILQLSDFHFNDRDGFVDAASALLNGLRCDLCLLTGDYRFNRTASCRSVYSGLRRVLEGVTIDFGTLAILGNNDMSDFVQGFLAMEIRTLINESVAVSVGGESIWITGVDDPHEFHCDDIQLATRDVPEGAFSIILAHSPELVGEAARYGFDFYLCGHTHGGQVALPFIGAPFMNSRGPRKYAFGRWKYGDMQGYTTSGLGASTVPIRYNCLPEAVLFELKRVE
jgi:predicted MPP superfamily phosphohydrolase